MSDNSSNVVTILIFFPPIVFLFTLCKFKQLFGDNLPIGKTTGVIEDISAEFVTTEEVLQTFNAILVGLNPTIFTVVSDGTTSQAQVFVKVIAHAYELAALF
jgi:hypothetical protein